MSEKVIHASHELLTLFLWLDVHFSPKNVLVTAIQRCLKFSFTPGHYYVMTLLAFGFEAIWVIEGSNFKLL